MFVPPGCMILVYAIVLSFDDTIVFIMQE
jgi:hypothetical protein